MTADEMAAHINRQCELSEKDFAEGRTVTLDEFLKHMRLDRDAMHPIAMYGPRPVELRDEPSHR